MGIDRFGSTPIALRGGSQANQTLEVILDDLNNARGTAYDVQENSAVWMENYSYAQALTSLFNANERFKNQYNPTTMYQFLGRWEKILGIIPPLNSTITQRQKIVSLYFQRWTLPPTVANLNYFAEQLLDSCFLGFQFFSSSQQGTQFATIPSNLLPVGISTYQIPGGALIQNGNWQSLINYITVNIWQPTDKYGNLLMDNATFTSLKNIFYAFFNSYLPAYCSYGSIQANRTVATGTVYGYLNSNIITGVGTTFTTSILTAQNGNTNTIFVIDDSGNPQILIVSNIISDTKLQISTNLNASITGSIYYPGTTGFFRVDFPNQLDTIGLF